MKQVWVIYEDRRSQPRAGFTLHQFVTTCVRRRVAPAQQQTVEMRLLAVTPKSVGEALKRFRDLESGRGEHRVLLVDRDRVTEHIPGNLPRDACRQRVFEQILQAKTPTAGQQTVVLMEQNLEDFLRHIGSSQHFPPAQQKELDAAVNKARGAPQARDLVLDTARRNEALRAHAETFPSIARLVAKLVALLDESG